MAAQRLGLRSNRQAWLSLAAAQGDAVASEHRGRLAAAMTPEQIAEAERLTRAWRLKP
jgi:hypothetical protein